MSDVVWEPLTPLEEEKESEGQFEPMTDFSQIDMTLTDKDKTVFQTPWEDLTPLQLTRPDVQEQIEQLRAYDPEYAAKSEAAVYFSDMFGVPFEEALEMQGPLAKAYEEDFLTWGETVKLSWQIGQYDRRAGEVGYRLMMSRDDDVWADIYKDAQQLIANYPSEDTRKRSLFTRAVKSTARLLPNMLGAATEGAQAGLATGGTAALLASPGGPAASAAAFGTMFTAGTAIQAARYTMEQEAGLAFVQMLAEGTDPTIARYAATGIGAVNAMLETAQLGTVVKSLPGAKRLFSRAVEEGVEQVIKRGLLNRLVQAPIDMAKDTATETLQEVAQESVQIVFSEVASAYQAKLEDEGYELPEINEVLGQLEAVMIDSALGFGLISSVGPVTKIAQGAVESMAANRQQETTPEPDAVQQRMTDERVQELLPTEEQEQAVEEVAATEAAEVPVTPAEEIVEATPEIEEEEAQEIEGSLSEAAISYGFETEEAFLDYAHQMFDDVELPSDATLQAMWREANPPKQQDRTPRPQVKPSVEESLAQVAATYESADEFANDVSSLYLGVELPDETTLRSIWNEAQRHEPVDSPAAVNMFDEDTEVQEQLRYQKEQEAVASQAEEAQAAEVVEPQMSEGTDTLKQTIMRAVGKTRIDRLVTESEALAAGIKKAERAWRQGIVEGKKQEKSRVKELKARQAEIKAIKDRIRKQVADIKKIVKKATKKNTPYDRVQRNEILNLVEGLDLVWKRSSKKIAKLNATAKFLKEEGNAIDMPDHIVEELAILNKTPFSELTPDQIETLHTAVMLHDKIAETKRQIKVRKVQRDYEETMADIVSSMPKGNYKPKPLKTLGMTKKQKMTETDKRRRSIRWFLGIAQDQPKRVVERIFGETSTGFDVFWQQVTDGETEKLGYLHQWQDQLAEAFESKGMDLDKQQAKWAREEVTTKVGDRTWKMDRGRRIFIYLASFDENYRASMLTGIGFRDSKDPNYAQPFKEEDLNAIIESLTPEELTVAEVVQEHFAKQGELIREKGYELDGYERKMLDNYLPKYPMPAYRNTGSDYESEGFIDAAKAQYARVGVDKSRLIERTDAKLPVYVDNVFDVLGKTMMEDAAYLALEEPLRNASKAINNKQLRNEILKRWGPIEGANAYQYIQQYLKDMAGATKDFSKFADFVKRHSTGITSSALGMNLGVSIKQVLSYPFAADRVPFHRLIIGAMQYSLQPRKSTATHIDSEPRLRERFESGHTHDIADALSKDGAFKRLFGVKTLKELGFVTHKMADKATVTSLANATIGWITGNLDKGKVPKNPELRRFMEAQRVSEKDLLGMGTEEQEAFAYKYFREVAGDTQPQFSTDYKSEFRRDSAIGYMMSFFSSFTNTERNMFHRALADAKKGNFRRLAYFGTAFSMNTLGVFLADSVRDAIRGKENDDDLDEQIAKAFAKSFAGMYYGARDVVGAAIDGRDVELPVARIINYLPSIARNAVNMVSQDSSSRSRQIAAQRLANDGLDLFLMMNGVWFGAKRTAEQFTPEAWGLRD